MPYSHKHFLRRVPNHLLKRYFIQNGLFSDFDFSALKGETDINPIIDELQKLEKDIPDDCAKIFAEFTEVNQMATEIGTHAIIEVINTHKEEIKSQIHESSSNHERAMWAFLEFLPHEWAMAIQFNRADGLRNFSETRRILKIPKVNVTKEALLKLESKIAEYFHKEKGQGKNCQVDHYDRDGRFYFFAYPENHSQDSIVWSESKLVRQTFRPAFEIIFAYLEHDGELKIYAPRAGKNQIKSLKNIFVEIILGITPEQLEEDENIYNLDTLSSQSFIFDIAPKSPIERIIIKELRIDGGIHGDLVLKINKNSTAYECLGEMASDNMKPFRIIEVKFEVSFKKSLKQRKKIVTISLPNRCNLQDDIGSLAIHEVLLRSGIYTKSKE
jgi:hypothetical protein